MSHGAVNPQPTVYVVDADEAVRDSLRSLLTLHGFNVDRRRAFLYPVFRHVGGRRPTFRKTR